MCGDFAKVKIVSTVDKIKEAYRLLGWDGEKTEEHRKALSDIKDISTKTLDHPFKYISNQIYEFFSNSDDEILFIHSRDPEEIRRFVKIFGCKTLLVRNDRVPDITSNHADANVELYENYDYIIENNGEFKHLESLAKDFVDSLRGTEEKHGKNSKVRKS